MSYGPNDTATLVVVHKNLPPEKKSVHVRFSTHVSSPEEAVEIALDEVQHQQNIFTKTILIDAANSVIVVNGEKKSLVGLQDAQTLPATYRYGPNGENVAIDEAAAYLSYAPGQALFFPPCADCM